MNGWKVSRRKMLRGMGAAISLPLLDVMERPAVADVSSANATRVCYLYFPNGVADDAWGSQRLGDDGRILQLNRWMSPLDSLRDHLLIPRNLWTPRGNGHGAGTATWLTGGNYDRRDIHAGGISADQIAAQKMGRHTLLPSLELSLRGEGFFSNSLVRNTISWSKSGPLPRDVEPRVVFDRMFRSSGDKQLERSVIDSVLEDAKTMRRNSSLADRKRIDEYLQAIRSIERRLEFADQQAQRAAHIPAVSSSLKRPDKRIPADHGEYMRTMFDMMVLAFWSDATRISTFMLDHGQSNRYFDFIDGVRGTWHALSHWKDASGTTEDDDGTTSWASPAQKREQYNRVTRWHTEQVAYFLNRLKQIREPNGQSLLDSSIVLYGSSLADGHEHAERNLPLLIAGGGNGTIRSGREIEFRPDTSMSKLHLALLQRIAPNVKSFGETDAPLKLD